MSGKGQAWGSKLAGTAWGEAGTWAPGRPVMMDPGHSPSSLGPGPALPTQGSLSSARRCHTQGSGRDHLQEALLDLGTDLPGFLLLATPGFPSSILTPFPRS